ncbi:CPBP family intramembrane glutamic endopeptidase [Cellulomonas fengjieae]|uniref:CPBP family intramembrane metalloprotease n=1 Tax=Cellulomonas fengjieae TaxID=2819978 RepID=A0ABS3SJS5_9CELL|nr:CPBP family intramembrane glutamic endopeptidase [Cellulomonas fengjieae]MBO3085996.1 CPBP family intramembrane metalloprotease [Cellulomonas fengjieae]MBO3103945.1 CPBP family intramembrane metalloprotease [Cellulomonas fengjieae]QVI65934.1 CPBP family intramembrane metalloprotease [Cellulomonas fengjieae]
MTATTATPARTRRPASRRGVLVYAVGVLTLSTAGGLVMASSPDPATSAGALLFVLSPLLLAVGLRTVGREGWADAGLRLGRERGWYAVALLLFPVLFAVPIVLGALTGDVRVPPGAGQRFLTLFATGLVARIAFAAFEELGWRGYLEPRLAALGVPALRRHLTVGALWAVWHVPYIVALGDEYTELPLAAQLPLFTVAVLAMAVIWGVVRDRTGSVWPSVLGHGMANAVAFPLLAADVVVIDSPLVHAARPEGLVVLPLLVLTAALVYRRWGRSVPSVLSGA